LFAPTNVIEAWLNTINSQGYSGLAAFCILCEAGEKHSKKCIFLYCLVLLFSGLNGIYASFLAPFFLVQLYRYRSKSSLLFLLCSWLTAFVQLSIFITLLREQALDPNKFNLSDLFNILPMITCHWLMPICGIDTSLEAFKSAKHDSWFYLGFFAVIVIPLSVSIVDAPRKSEAIFLFIVFFAVSFLTKIASINGIPCSRYAVLAGYLLLIFILSQIDFKLAPLRSVIMSFLLLISLSSGIINYQKVNYQKVFFPDSNKCPPNNCPRWHEEVAKWRSNPEYELAIWPAYWRMRLER
jgi:hypothetical protein